MARSRRQAARQGLTIAFARRGDGDAAPPTAGCLAQTPSVVKPSPMNANASFRGLAALALATAARAELPAHPQAEAQALDLAKQAIAMRSVRGPNNETPKVAKLYADALIAGGFAPGEVTITPMDDTAYLIARWQGSDPTLKPLVISGHMDVVEAKPADWKRDPFTPVVENGYLFGRGATDMKLDGTLAIAALIELKREGYQAAPRHRHRVFRRRGDDDGDQRRHRREARRTPNWCSTSTAAAAAGREDRQAALFHLAGRGEDLRRLQLTVTNPGGHSSMPRADNAIDRLAAALLRIQAHPLQARRRTTSPAPISRAPPSIKPPETAAAMRAFAANPADPQAIAALAADPAMIGKIGTTCVVTMISGGHALNALPQRATANINCRIFPGHTPRGHRRRAARGRRRPEGRAQDVTRARSSPTPRPCARTSWPRWRRRWAGLSGRAGLPGHVLGRQRQHVVPPRRRASYGASPVFIKDSEDFSHGLNERTPLSNLRPAIDYYLILVKELAG